MIYPGDGVRGIARPLRECRSDLSRATVSSPPCTQAQERSSRNATGSSRKARITAPKGRSEQRHTPLYIWARAPSERKSPQEKTRSGGFRPAGKRFSHVRNACNTGTSARLEQQPRASSRAKFAPAEYGAIFPRSRKMTRQRQTDRKAGTQSHGPLWGSRAAESRRSQNSGRHPRGNREFPVPK